MVLAEAPPLRQADASPNEAPTRWLGWALIVLGIGAASVALLGPLVSGIIDYHASEGAGNQIVGGDVAGLFLVAPLSVTAGMLVLSGRFAGRVLALGPAMYALYMYSQLALGGEVVRYPGNSERFFLIFVGLFVLAGAVAVGSWSGIEPERLPPPGRRTERILSGFFLVVALFLTAGLHLPGLLDAWWDQPGSSEYLADPVVFWLVKFMDLGIVVPLLVAIAVGVLRRRCWARKAMYAGAAWAALLGSSVAGMAIVMQMRGDPAASPANTVAFGVFAVVALGLAWTLHRPLLVRSGEKLADTTMR